MVVYLRPERGVHLLDPWMVRVASQGSLADNLTFFKKILYNICIVKFLDFGGYLKLLVSASYAGQGFFSLEL